VIDIVANDLGLDPRPAEAELREGGRVPRGRNAERVASTTPATTARCLDLALELVGYDGIDNRPRDSESTGHLLLVGIGSTLYSGTNTSYSRAPEPGAAGLLRQQTKVGDGEARIFVRRVVSPYGTVPRDRGRDYGPRQVVATPRTISPYDVTVRPGTTLRNSQAGFLRHLTRASFAVTYRVLGESGLRPTISPAHIRTSRGRPRRFPRVSVVLEGASRSCAITPRRRSRSW